VRAGSEGWQMAVEVGGTEWRQRASVRGDGLQGGGGLAVDAMTGERVETIEKGWVEEAAELRELVKLRWVVGIVDGEHAGGGRGGLGERRGTVEDDDGESAAMEFKSEREADDAGSGY